MSLTTAYSLSLIHFPDCYHERCSAARLLGVGECESICPYKFSPDGNPRQFEAEEAVKFWDEAEAK